MSIESDQIEACRPMNERYIGSRALSLIVEAFGERGRAAQNLYTYFRWVDNTIDQETSSPQAGYDFLSRQFDIVIGATGTTNAGEKLYASLPWEAIPKTEVIQHSRVLLASIQEVLNIILKCAWL